MMVNSTMPLSTDDAYARLHSSGWSVGDLSYWEDGRRVWMVYVHRGEQKIVARADSQLDAWVRAQRMAAEIESR